MSVHEHRSLQLSRAGLLIAPLQTFNWLFHADIPLEGFWVNLCLADLRTVQGGLSRCATVSQSCIPLYGVTHAKAAIHFFTYGKKWVPPQGDIADLKVKEEEGGRVMRSKCAFLNLGQSEALIFFSVVQCCSDVDKTHTLQCTSLFTVEGCGFFHLSVSRICLSQIRVVSPACRCHPISIAASQSLFLTSFTV